MAAAAKADSKPKRKRQRKRKALSSSEPESSSDSDSSSEDEAPPPPKEPTPAPESSESDSSSDSSSDEESEAGYRGRRRGKKVAAKAAVAAAAAAADSTAHGTASAAGRSRAYPARSPSPELQPNNVPLGQGIFPALKARPSGPILAGSVPGDDGFEAEDGQQLQPQAGGSAAAAETEFGAWWRARLVHEFESELAPLAAEQGLTAPRLELLLESLTSLAHLHTTSSEPAKHARSIWYHDPSTAIDPLAGLAVDEMGEEWGKRAVGGEGDVEVGAEGVKLDEHRKQRKEEHAQRMELDE